MQGFLRGLGQLAQPLARFLAQQVGRVAQDLPRFADGTRDPEGELGPGGTVGARDAGRGFQLRRHFTHDLARLRCLDALVLAELGLRAFRVRVADEFVVLRGLALDRGRASLMAASLACLLGHRSLLLSGKRLGTADLWRNAAGARKASGEGPGGIG
jgi:hypothetical protein